MTIVAGRDQAPYQLRKRDETIYDNGRPKEFGDILDINVNKITGQVQKETAKRIVRHFMVEPPIFADAGTNTHDNTIESFKQEIEILNNHCADYKKETKKATGKLDGLENALNEARTALANAKADFLMAESNREGMEQEVKVSRDLMGDLQKQLELADNKIKGYSD